MIKIVIPAFGGQFAPKGAWERFVFSHKDRGLIEEVAPGVYTVENETGTEVWARNLEDAKNWLDLKAKEEQENE